MNIELPLDGVVAPSDDQQEVDFVGLYWSTFATLLSSNLFTDTKTILVASGERPSCLETESALRFKNKGLRKIERMGNPTRSSLTTAFNMKF